MQTKSIFYELDNYKDSSSMLVKCDLLMSKIIVSTKANNVGMVIWSLSFIIGFIILNFYIVNRANQSIYIYTVVPVHLTILLTHIGLGFGTGMDLSEDTGGSAVGCGIGFYFLIFTLIAYAIEHFIFRVYYYDWTALILMVMIIVEGAIGVLIGGLLSKILIASMMEKY